MAIALGQVEPTTAQVCARAKSASGRELPERRDMPVRGQSGVLDARAAFIFTHSSNLENIVLAGTVGLRPSLESNALFHSNWQLLFGWHARGS